MEFKYTTLFSIYITSLLVISHVSCTPSKFLFPTNNPSSYVEKTSISPSHSPLQSPSSSPPLVSPRSSIISIIDDLKKPIYNVPVKVLEACKMTDHPSECSASVTPLLNGNFEPLAILQSEAKAFDHALGVAREALPNVFSAVDDEQTIYSCQQMYDNAREEVAKAMELATTDDKFGVNIYLSAALTYIETCNDELPKVKKNDPTMVLMNKLLQDLASNCLALGNFAMGLDILDD